MNEYKYKYKYKYQIIISVKTKSNKKSKELVESEDVKILTEEDYKITGISNNNNLDEINEYFVKKLQKSIKIL